MFGRRAPGRSAKYPYNASPEPRDSVRGCANWGDFAARISSVMIDEMQIMLTAIEARILGALIEKETTTPEYYPLSLNALTNACNQKSNREPVLHLEESEVRKALHHLEFQS